MLDFWNVVFYKEQKNILALNTLWLQVHLVDVWNDRTEKIFLNENVLLFVLVDLFQIMNASLSTMRW